MNHGTNAEAARTIEDYLIARQIVIGLHSADASAQFMSPANFANTSNIRNNSTLSAT